MILKKLHSIFLKSSGVSTDTRTIEQGSIFFALKGPNFDGNKYAGEAINQGASYAIIDNKKYKKNNQYIVVDDVLTTLQELAKYHRSTLTIPIIGITGSNGKTTTKELIKSVLEQKYSVQATKGNLNNHIGVPLTLLSINKEHDIAIVEMGTNNKGEIKALAEMIRPTYGLVTSIGKAHLEGLKSLKGVAAEKLSLFDQVLMTGGKIFQNLDDKRIARYKSLKRKSIPYSLKGHGSYRFKVKRTFPNILIEIKSAEKEHKIKSSLIGEYNASNLISAIVLGFYFDILVSDMAKGIKAYKPKNRTQIKVYQGAKVYLDAYNANPTSMKLAIKAFAKGKSKRGKVLVLGDMFEVGSSSAKEHQKMVDYLQKYKWAYVILVGEHFYQTKSTINKSTIYKLKSNELLQQFINTKSLKDRLVLVKGSRSMRLEEAFN